MRRLIQELSTPHTPESLTQLLGRQAGVVLLRSALFEEGGARYSFVAANPFLTFRSSGSRCEIISAAGSTTQFGNPWQLLDGLMARYELLDELDLPFPLGGCFGYWGYDLKNFVEPRLSTHAINDLELPDAHVGFYDSVVVFDHVLAKTWVMVTGLDFDGSRSHAAADRQFRFWESKLQAGLGRFSVPALPRAAVCSRSATSNFSREGFIAAVNRALQYIYAGDIYQVNLSHRLSALSDLPPWEFFERLTAVSPAPFAAYLDCGDHQIASSSPESFLRMSGAQIRTRPIKGTRPRSADPTRDAQLSYELQTSPKEMSELVMITDLLRNDLGRVCEFGSVHVPELVRLERYPQVQHLVSTVEGTLRADVTHFAALASCFPGGSITGAPKIRAMEIIDELETISRGPYTGCIGYLGFNRESQLSIAIRTAICRGGSTYFHAGAGIVADSNPAAEYDETLAKAQGFFSALKIESCVPGKTVAGEGEEGKHTSRHFRSILPGQSH